MATLIFAQAKYIRRLQLDAIRNNDNPAISNDFIADSILEIQSTEFRNILEISMLLNEDFKESNGSTTNWFFISIRPKPCVEFKDFYKLVKKYVERLFMIEYKLSFEQKDELGSGKGFHVHIVCFTKHGSNIW